MKPIRYEMRKVEEPASFSSYVEGVPKKLYPVLNGYCEGAVDSITLVFTQLHRSRFNLEFEELLEPILYVAADL